MRFDSRKDYDTFQKIKKKHTKSGRNNYFESRFQGCNDQHLGSVHLIKNSLVLEMSKETDSIDKKRPGCVLIKPELTNNFETLWVPISSKIKNRNDSTTVFLEPGVDDVTVPSCILLDIRSYYKCTTLESKVGKISNEKLEEALFKLGNYENI